jgi:TPR repeat protein
VSETTLERPVTAPKTGDHVAQSFDFDRRAFVLRVILCACLGACSIVISVISWNIVPIVLLLVVALPLTIVVAWFSHLRLRIPAPIISIDRDGLWDQRLGMDAIPWRVVRSIELDRDTDVILDVGDDFKTGQAENGADMHRFLPLGLARQSGKIRIKLEDIGVELSEFLAAIESILPHHMQVPVCPAVRRRRRRRLVRPIFAGVVTGMMAGLLIVTVGSLREDSAIYRGLGAAKDLGVQLGERGAIGFRRRADVSAGTVSDPRIRRGYLYHEGIEAPLDDVRAAHWFGLAAADGVAVGQAAMGYFRENGIGVAQDFVKALTWYDRAARQGDVWALTRRALMYRDGRGVRRDQAEAYRLFEAAAVRGDAAARYYLGEANEYGWGVAENIATAAQWYRKAAAQGHARAEYKLGAFYREGRSVQQDEGRATKWFARSARKGYAPAQYALGMAYELGLSVAPDSKQAVLWYFLAEWHGHPAARHRRMQYLAALNHQERRVADAHRRRWLRENFLAGRAAETFAEYRKIDGIKAFAASMNDAFAIVDDARNQNEAAQRAMARCRRFAQTCLLYALGDTVVIGMGETQIDALIAQGDPARRQ